MMKFEWENIHANHVAKIGGSNTARARIKGGWIVSLDLYTSEKEGTNRNVSTSMVFIPDPKHEWSISDENENTKLSLSIDDLYLNTRIMNIFKSMNINSLENLLEKHEYEFMRKPNFGLNSLYILKTELAKHGLTLKPYLK